MFRMSRVLRHRINIDGEGIVSLVGLMGCPLSCEYCLNQKMLRSKSYYDVSAEDLLETLMQDACYMIATNGGVTFGGGEPLLYYKDLLAFAKMKPDWMRLNIETALQVPSEIVTGLIPYVDSWIVDIKTLDESLYEKYTKGSIHAMRANLNILAVNAADKCLIRIPIIPNFKDKTAVDKEQKAVHRMGFHNTDVFEYTTKI